MAPEFETLEDAAAGYGDWLTAAALPLWSSAGVDAERGVFQEALTLHGAASGARRRARVQSRQIWVFATAAAAGWGADYGELARRAYEAYRAHYRRPDALFAFSADAQGQVIDSTAALYEQAFSLLAMAALERLSPGALRADASATRVGLNAFRHEGGGFCEAGEHPFQANAHMHLFEAALAWEDAGDESWRNLADELAELALRRFVDREAGVLREFFDARWTPLSDAEGGLLEPGHHLEWAWLIGRWAERRRHAEAAAVAPRLFRTGLCGVDARRNVAVGGLWSDLSVRDPVARLWAQTERLRAALTFGTPAESLAAARGLAPYLDTPVRGVWRDKMKADGSFVDEPAPATSLYHLVAGLQPLIGRGA